MALFIIFCCVIALRLKEVLLWCCYFNLVHPFISFQIHVGMILMKTINFSEVFVIVNACEEKRGGEGSEQMVKSVLG